MKRSISTVALTLALIASVSLVAGAAASGISQPAAPVIQVQSAGISDQYVVVLKPGADPRSVAAAAGVNPRFVYSAAVQGFAGTLSTAQVTALQRHPSVQYIEQDQEMSISITQTGATWGLDRINQRALPLDGTYSYTTTGAGVNAYIIDTGIRFSHSEFGGRAVSGFDSIDGGSADDCNGHGTHVSGTVGGTIYGVAKNVSLIAVRVLNCRGSGSTSGVIAGVDWATSDHQPGQPAVANMSLGGGASTALDTAVNNAISDGISFAVAAGNGNIIGIAQDACKYSPARVPRAMTIAATNDQDTRASWSNFGGCVDWFAPGVGITSAWWTSDTDTNTISGTSMASPHTAGVAALYLESNPGASPLTVRGVIYNGTTKGIVTSSKTANNHLLFMK